MAPNQKDFCLYARIVIRQRGDDSEEGRLCPVLFFVCLFGFFMTLIQIPDRGHFSSEYLSLQSSVKQLESIFLFNK